MSTFRERRAFTLMELIVAMAITSVIALFVFSFATNLARLWRSNESGVGTELDAQIALDRIAMDLESAILQERGVPMFAVSAISQNGNDAYDYDLSGRWEDVTITGAGRPSTLHFDPDTHHYGWAGSWLRFFSAAPSMNAVGYQIIRRSAFSDSEIPLYLLHRAVVRHDKTLEAGYDITLLEDGDGNAVGYGETSSNQNWAGEITHPILTSVLVEDVVDFGVRLYVFDDSFVGDDHSPEGLKMIYPVVAGDGTIDTNETEHIAQSWEGSVSDRYPDVVEIFIRVLDDVGSDELFRAEEVEAGRDYSEIIEEHSRVYRRMVRLPGRKALG